MNNAKFYVFFTVYKICHIGRSFHNEHASELHNNQPTLTLNFEGHFIKNLLANPCGGGVEYLHRDPASRKRRRNGAKKGRAIA
jgi:hypothetical protein